MTMKNWIRIALALTAAAAIPACGGSNDPMPSGTSWVQVERLARPAINEGLFVTNDFLNAVNSIRPDQDGAALVGPVAAEAVATLQALGQIGTANAVTPPQPGDVVAALIPDVMRIDTTLPAIPLGTGAYAFMARTGLGAGATGVMPIAGRKLEDDVIDITYQVLTGVPGLGDGVPYYKPAGGAGSTNPAIGHNKLHGQAAIGAGQSATFPFLADPN
jgi:Domain of unknown function (DUF4331)